MQSSSGSCSLHCNPGVCSFAVASGAAVKHCSKLRLSAQHRQTSGRVLIPGWVPVSELPQDCEVHTLFLTFASRQLEGELTLRTEKYARIRSRCLRIEGEPRPAVGLLFALACALLIPALSCPPRGTGFADTSSSIEVLTDAGLQAQRTVRVSEAVMQKLCGFESIRGGYKGWL